MRRAILTALLAGGLLGAPSAHGAAKLERVEIFTVSWVGDIAFSADRGLPTGDVRGAIGPLKYYLRADIVTGNLEGTLATGGASKCGKRRRAAHGGDCFAFRAPPRYAPGLRRGGVRPPHGAHNHPKNNRGTRPRANTPAPRGA